MQQEAVRQEGKVHQEAEVHTVVNNEGLPPSPPPPPLPPEQEEATLLIDTIDAKHRPKGEATPIDNKCRPQGASGQDREPVLFCIRISTF